MVDTNKVENVSLEADFRKAREELVALNKVLKSNYDSADKLRKSFELTARIGSEFQSISRGLKLQDQLLKAMNAGVIMEERRNNMASRREKLERNIYTLGQQINNLNRVNVQTDEQKKIKNEQILRIRREQVEIAKKDLELAIQRGRASDKDIANLERRKKALASAQKDAGVSDKLTPNARRIQEALASGEGLFLLQGRLMANYMVWNRMLVAIRAVIREVVGLDAEFRKLQAIAGLTDYQLEGLRETILKISQATRFTGREVAQAATILAQAGYSTDEIAKTLPAITKLAAATGEDLANTTALVTSAIDVFNLSVDQSASITDKFTTAINQTKLTLPRLNAGLQYTGNLAAELGISLDETIAMMGAMAQSGVRTASMFGTGPRAFLTQLTSPTEKAEGIFKRLGLTSAERDIETLGLTQVLRNITEAGFTAGDAMQAFGTRGGAAFLAVARNINTMDDLRLSIAQLGATTAANDAQMKSLENSILKLQAATVNAISKSLNPLLQLLRGIVTATAEAVETFSGLEDFWGGALSLAGNITTAFVTLTATVMGLSFALKSLFGLIKVVTGASGAMGIASLLGGGTALGATPVLVTVTALAAAIGAYNTFIKTQKDLQSAANEASISLDTQNNRVNTLTQTYESLITRSSLLKTNQREFEIVAADTVAQLREMGFNVDGTVKSYGDLVKLAREFLIISSEQTAEEAEKAIQAQKNLFEGTRAKATRTIFSPVKELFQGVTPETELSSLIGVINKLDNIPEDIRAGAQQTVYELQNAQIRIAQLERKKDQALDARNFSEPVEKLVMEITNLTNALKKDPESFLNNASNIRKIMQITSMSPAGSAAQKDQYFKELGQFTAEYQDVLQRRSTGDTKNLKEWSTTLDRIEKNLAGMSPDEFARQSQTGLELLKKMEEANKRTLELMRAGGESEAVIAERAKTMQDRLDIAKESFTRRAADTAISLENLFDEFKASFEMLTSRIKTQRILADAEIANIQANIDMRKASLSLARQPQFKGAAGDLADYQALATLVQGRISSAQVGLGGLREQFSSQELEARVREAQRNLENVVSKGGAASPQERNLATERLGKAQKDLETYISQINEYNKEIIDGTTKLDEYSRVVEELNIRQMQTGQIQETIKMSARNYNEELTKTGSMFDYIKQMSNGTFSAMQTGMSDFIATTTQGTEKISDAFRNMAISILKSLNQIASQQVAQSIMQFALSAIGGMAGGPTITNAGALQTTPVEVSNLAPIGGSAHGGLIRRAMGGIIPGRDVGRDSVLGMLRPGEYVVQKSAVSVLGKDFMDNLNQGRVPAVPTAVPVDTGSQGGVVNVWVVSEDQVPPPSASDIIATVGDNIQRGGPLKQLIQSVAVGRRN